MAPLQMRLDGRRLPDLVVLATLAGLVLWYLRDAIDASTHVSNLILVLPVAVIVVVLCALECVSQITGKAQAVEQTEPIKAVAPLMGLFAGYVLSLNWLGFDVGTFAFVALHLRFLGRRSWPWSLAYGISLAVILSAFFSLMLPYPMPLLVFPAGG